MRTHEEAVCVPGGCRAGGLGIRLEHKRCFVAGCPDISIEPGY